MSDFFLSGYIVDLILGFVVLEVAVLAAYRQRTGSGPALGDLISMLLPGVCLLLAMRVVIIGSDWTWAALFLLLSLVCHLADLRRRWPSRTS